MKESSIQEKAKAYDEAIKKAKNTIEVNQTIPDIVECVESLFPELKESEDERIRKELICYFEKYPSIVIGPFNTKECIAWLEKQSTPQVRTGLEWVNTIDDACDKRYLEEYAHGEYCHEQSFKWGFQEGVDWLEKQKGTEREIEGNSLCNGEQKPVVPRFRVGDIVENIFTNDQRRVTSIKDDSYITDNVGFMSFYDQDDWELVEQESVELEKEEKSRLMKKCVHRAYQQGYDTGFHMATTELEHKQEWSEEDERKINYLIALLQNSTMNHDDLRVMNESCEDWLKSLRPQPRWKPSDLPHWKKSTLPNDNTTGFNSDYFCHKGYNINYKELFEKLPKDE